MTKIYKNRILFLISHSSNDNIPLPLPVLLFTGHEFEPLSHRVTQHHRQLCQISHNHIVRERECVQVRFHRNGFLVGGKERHPNIQYRMLQTRNKTL